MERIRIGDESHRLSGVRTYGEYNSLSVSELVVKIKSLSASELVLKKTE